MAFRTCEELQVKEALYFLLVPVDQGGASIMMWGRMCAAVGCGLSWRYM